VRNKGCAGLSYHLDYVEKPERFDEVVEQDGVKVLIDSKALFSIIGSEMDWKEDALRYTFPVQNCSTVPLLTTDLLIAPGLRSRTPTFKMHVAAGSRLMWRHDLVISPFYCDYSLELCSASAIP
jgi:hypothetical protein